MKKDIIVNLIKDVNSKIRNKTIAEMLVSKANDYFGKNLNESEIFNKMLADITQLNATIKNKEVSELVENYSKFKETDNVTIKKLASEICLPCKLATLKSSNAFSDPVIKTAISRIEETLKTTPEFRAIPAFIETLKPHAYAPEVKAVIQETQDYVAKNSSKLILLNSIYEFNMVPTNSYADTVKILEQALLDGQTSVDSIKMKLREKLEIPAIKRLVNNLSLVESRNTKGFNLGLGNGSTAISSIIVPAVKVNEGILTVLNNRYVKISEGMVSYVEPKEVFESYNDFYTFTTNFVNMKFSDTRDGIRAKMRNMEVEFKNEGADLSVYINNKKVEDVKKVNYSELFVMESGSTKNMVSQVFENSDMIKSLDFIKKLAKSDKTAIAVNLESKIFVLENNHSGQVLEMTPVQFVGYVKENFDYDASPMFADMIDGTQMEVDSIEAEKDTINSDIAKLETAAQELDFTEEDADPEILEKANDLKFAIEKNINSLKERYIQLETKKKALLEHNIISSTKKHNLDDQIMTRDGRAGKVRGVDGATGRYMIAFEDGKILPIKESEIV
jgi:hypothetical protein